MRRITPMFCPLPVASGGLAARKARGCAASQRQHPRRDRAWHRPAKFPQPRLCRRPAAWLDRTLLFFADRLSHQFGRSGAYLMIAATALRLGATVVTGSKADLRPAVSRWKIRSDSVKQPGCKFSQSSSSSLRDHFLVEIKPWNRLQASPASSPYADSFRTQSDDPILISLNGWDLATRSVPGMP